MHSRVKTLRILNVVERKFTKMSSETVGKYSIFFSTT